MKKAEIKNFIGIYDGYITPDNCADVIKTYDTQDNFNKAFTRMQFEGAEIFHKKDKHCFLHQDVNLWWKDLKITMTNFDLAFKHYIKETGADVFSNHYRYTQLKIQKTEPGEGYHVWHVEHSYNAPGRAFAFIIYLNDIKEAGETEFLHQKTRVSPKQGRIVIWPASFPYVHRGNPPLSETKYILTSWLLLPEDS